MPTTSKMSSPRSRARLSSTVFGVGCGVGVPVGEGAGDGARSETCAEHPARKPATAKAFNWVIRLSFPGARCRCKEILPSDCDLDNRDDRYIWHTHYRSNRRLDTLSWDRPQGRVTGADDRVPSISYLGELARPQSTCLRAPTSRCVE